MLMKLQENLIYIDLRVPYYFNWEITFIYFIIKNPFN